MGAGGYVGEAEHSPAFMLKAGEAQAFGQSPIVHISTGTSSWSLCEMAAFAPLAEQYNGVVGTDLSTGANQS